MTKIGIISDTHDFLDPRIPEIFSEVEHILHAGDIGKPWIILQLECIAPVTVVLGNNDSSLSFKDTEIIELGARKFLIHHIVDVHRPAEAIERRIKRERPDVVVFGHSHKPFKEIIDGVLYFNPGYAGKPRFNQPRSVATLQCDKNEIVTELHEL